MYQLCQKREGGAECRIEVNGDNNCKYNCGLQEAMITFQQKKLPHKLNVCCKYYSTFSI